ncbi:acetate kinase [Allopseudospirillum japonicum]|uniref:Acetate kinase n=1 Tax=Allopseudospirillum japonicum TaxID=64971 RepID=A0A1H6QHU1_9GAMM|nr:acetate/propionate family kinase [Allopseudospirillum japonicum]SEI40524.1 acetate kinase [Allopseudospirillum japonicum]
MNMILIVNAGSSSLKCSLFDVDQGDVKQHYRVKVANLAGPARLEIYDHAENIDGVLVDKETLSAEQLDVAHGNAHAQALKVVIDWITHNTRYKIAWVGHRVVHGGTFFTAPVEVNADNLAQLESLIPLAPLHQPYNLKLIELCREFLPDCPQVACFDTAFHATIPHVASHFALPRQLTNEGVRRYGFHGLSYEYIHDKLSRLDPELGSKRLVVAHLGAGSSMCAINEGQSVASTMGFTAVEGLPMGSRCGQLDLGVILYLMREHKMSVDDIESLLYKQSGWQGVSGVSSDMLTLHQSDNPHAQEAIDMFVYRIARETGSLAAALGGVDVFVFTGGVGENDAQVRAQVAHQNEWLGMKLDPARNEGNEYLISADDSRIKVFAIPTNEEKMIARHTLRTLGVIA